MGDYEKAGEYYRRALNIEFDIYAVLGLAIVSKMEGKYDDAIESLRRLIQQDPKNYRLYIELADCWIKKGEKDRALEVLTEYQKLGVRSTAISEYIEKLST
jgi:tetratricopeptide (TPR) repeat protein